MKNSRQLLRMRGGQATPGLEGSREHRGAHTAEENETKYVTPWTTIGHFHSHTKTAPRVYFNPEEIDDSSEFPDKPPFPYSFRRSPLLVDFPVGSLPRYREQDDNFDFGSEPGLRERLENSSKIAVDELLSKSPLQVLTEKKEKNVVQTFSEHVRETAHKRDDEFIDITGDIRKGRRRGRKVDDMDLGVNLNDFLDTV
mmetsp:Transcript_20519/g.50352  ORF Transcript_20519/g.50352 Transcript_20519/m.50352 type:complete len:198 (+) Transcript_20519:3172-3765(+)